MIERTNAELEAELRRSLRGRRFLAPGGRGGNGHGYLSVPQRELPPVTDEPLVVERIGAAVAMCDEPEVVAPDAFSLAVARRRDAIRRAAEIEDMRERRKALTLEHRTADARRRAKAQHLDVRQALFVIGGLAPRDPVAAVQRMEELEALLDGAGAVERELA